MGAFEVFSAVISEHFAHSWWEPVARAGYRPELYPGEYVQQLRSLGVPPNEGEALSRFVRWGESEVQIAIRKNQEEKGHTVCWTLGMLLGNTLPNDLRELMWIFIASGVGPWAGRPGCRRLYRCQSGMAKRLLDGLIGADSLISLTVTEGQTGGTQSTGPGQLPQGRIEWDGVILHFRIGPASDPVGGEAAEFVALDYQMPWIVGRHRYNQVITEIAGRLVEQGAFEIVIRSGGINQPGIPLEQ